MRVPAVTAVTAVALASCAYYNAMWSAERLARDAARLELQGRDGEARNTWARAAVKAESVLARHPRSRWADDALVLRGEALARSGACAAAKDPLARARRTVADAALRERADLAAARCALQVGSPVAAAELLDSVLASRDAGRRSRAAFLAGQAAAVRGDWSGAALLFGRSGEPAAGPARVRVLLAAGRTSDATALLDTLAARRFVEADWTALLDELHRAAGPAAASRALDRMLARTRPAYGARGRLLLVDGDRLLASGDVDGAAARYAAVLRLVPTAPEGELARVRRLRTVAARADSLAELAPVNAELDRMARTGTGGAGAQAAQALRQLLDSIVTPDAGEPGMFRAAELARDSLHAPRLAGRLFLRFAAQHPASLFAAKALVAALPLLPERSDSIAAVLDATYAASPYTRALRGEAPPAYGAAEDSLAQALGVRAGSAAQLVVSRVSPPIPGPRGPWLDDGPAGPERSPPRRRPVPERPDRPERAERP